MMDDGGDSNIVTNLNQCIDSLTLVHLCICLCYFVHFCSTKPVFWIFQNISEAIQSLEGVLFNDSRKLVAILQKILESQYCKCLLI